MGPGTKRPSIKSRSGEPRIPIPNPTAPCRVNPATLQRTTSTVSSGDIAGLVFAGEAPWRALVE